MKKSTKISLLLLSVFIFACIAYIWLNYSPTMDEYRWRTHALDTEFTLASSFADALMMNHPVAYDWIDPSLKPRLDQWMNSHQGKRCDYDPDWAFVGPDENGHYDTSFGCFGPKGLIEFDVENIVIKDMKVVDWGEIREGD